MDIGCEYPRSLIVISGLPKPTKPNTRIFPSSGYMRRIKAWLTINQLRLPRSTAVNLQYQKRMTETFIQAGARRQGIRTAGGRWILAATAVSGKWSLCPVRMWTSRRQGGILKSGHPNDSTFASYTVLGSQGSTSFPYKGTWKLKVGDTGSYRYIRIVKTVNDYLFVSEFKVSVNPENVAAGKTATASTEYSASFAAGKANDGDTATGWSPASGDTNRWWQVDLGEQVAVNRIELVSRQDEDQPETRRSFEVQASNTGDFSDGVILAQKGNINSFPHQGTYTMYINNTGTYRYIRIRNTADQYMFLSEVRILK